MKVTEERLKIVEAAIEECAKTWARSPTTAVNPSALLESLPEPEPLPAPTGPGVWFARAKSPTIKRKWWPVVIEPDNSIFAIGWVEPVPREWFDAWVGPLAEPEVRS